MSPVAGAELHSDPERPRRRTERRLHQRMLRARIESQ